MTVHPVDAILGVESEMAVRQHEAPALALVVAAVERARTSARELSRVEKPTPLAPSVAVTGLVALCVQLLPLSALIAMPKSVPTYQRLWLSGARECRKRWSRD